MDSLLRAIDERQVGMRGPGFTESEESPWPARMVAFAKAQLMARLSLDLAKTAASTTALCMLLAPTDLVDFLLGRRSRGYGKV